MKTKVTAIIVGVIAFIAVIIVISGVRTIQTGELGVVKTFGVAKSIIEPGIHFIIPGVNSLAKYDTKTREVMFDFQAYSKDAQTVVGQLSVQYNIQAGHALDIATQYGSMDLLEAKLRTIIPERAKSVFSDKGAMTLVETRSILSGEIKERITPETEKYFVDITMVALSDISFNDAFESAVEQKMVSEQEKLRAGYEKEKAIIKAQEQLEVAKLDAESNIEKANGDAKALQIMQQAWSSLSAEVKDAMLKQVFYEKWNGVLPQVMGGDGMDFIIGESLVKPATTTAPVTQAP